LACATARAADAGCVGKGRRTLADIQLERLCREDALARAVAQANVPTLTALHDGLAAAQRIDARRGPLDERQLAAVSAAAESMRADNSTKVIAALR
jgi:hypothetical protein